MTEGWAGAAGQPRGKFITPVKTRVLTPLPISTPYRTYILYPYNTIAPACMWPGKSKYRMSIHIFDTRATINNPFITAPSASVNILYFYLFIYSYSTIIISAVLLYYKFENMIRESIRKCKICRVGLKQFSRVTMYWSDLCVGT